MSEGHIYLGSCTKRSLSDYEGGSSRRAKLAARVDDHDRATIHKASNHNLRCIARDPSNDSDHQEGFGCSRDKRR
jgi:hypothetical protein